MKEKLNGKRWPSRMKCQNHMKRKTAKARNKKDAKKVSKNRTRGMDFSECKNKGEREEEEEKEDEDEEDEGEEEEEE